MRAYVSQVTSEPGTDVYWTPWVVVTVEASGLSPEDERHAVEAALGGIEPRGHGYYADDGGDTATFLAAVEDAVRNMLPLAQGLPNGGVRAFEAQYAFLAV